MHQIVQLEIEERKTLCYHNHDRHLFKIDEMRDYFKLIESEAKLSPVKPVIWGLLKEMEQTRQRDPKRYKDINYRLVDKDKFEVIPN